MPKRKEYFEVVAALMKLGYKKLDDVRIERIEDGDCRCRVWLGSEYIGIWDCSKETFVD